MFFPEIFQRKFGYGTQYHYGRYNMAGVPGEVDTQTHQKDKCEGNSLCKLNWKIGTALYDLVIVTDSQKSFIGDAVAAAHEVAADFGNAVHQRDYQRVGL